jgi:ATP synthase delta (OSCP) subunit
MVYENLWRRIREVERLPLLLDLIGVLDFADNNPGSWFELGMLHSLNPNKLTAIDILRTELKLVDLSYDLLSGLTDYSWDKLYLFCEHLVTTGREIMGVKFVRCITAKHMTDKQKNDLYNKLKEIIQSPFLITYAEDQDIIGGTILQIDGIEFNSSYSRIIDKLEQDCLSYMLTELGEAKNA